MRTITVRSQFSDLGDPPPPAGAATTEAAFPLPATFQDVAFRRDKGLKLFEARGVLTINPDVLEFISEKARVSVPVKSIRSVFTGGLGVNHSIQWVIVEYEASGSAETAGFLSLSFLFTGVVDQPLLSTIKSAVEASKRGPTPATGPGDAAP